MKFIQYTVTQLWASIFFLGRQPQRVQCQSLCGSEVTRKIKHGVRFRSAIWI